MKCEKCNGTGSKDNPKYWDKSNDSYIMHNPKTKCKKCGGSGFIIGNVKDVLTFLHYLNNTNQLLPTDRKDLQQCIDTIEKY